METPGKGWVFLENASIFLLSFSTEEDSYLMVNVHKLANIYVNLPGGGHATHSSILAWRIPWTEEPGGLQSMRSQRIGHDRAAKHITLP